MTHIAVCQPHPLQASGVRGDLPRLWVPALLQAGKPWAEQASLGVFGRRLPPTLARAERPCCTAALPAAAALNPVLLPHKRLICYIFSDAVNGRTKTFSLSYFCSIMFVGEPDPLQRGAPGGGGSLPGLLTSWAGCWDWVPLRGGRKARQSPRRSGAGWPLAATGQWSPFLWPHVCPVTRGCGRIGVSPTPYDSLRALIGLCSAQVAWEAAILPPESQICPSYLAFYCTAGQLPSPGSALGSFQFPLEKHTYPLEHRLHCGRRGRLWLGVQPDVTLLS